MTTTFTTPAPRRSRRPARRCGQHQPRVRAQARSTGLGVEALEQERGHIALPATRRSAAAASASAQHARVQLPGQAAPRPAAGWTTTTAPRRADLGAGPQDRRPPRPRDVHPPRHRRGRCRSGRTRAAGQTGSRAPSRPSVSSRSSVAPHVEDRLDPGADDADRRPTPARRGRRTRRTSAPRRGGRRRARRSRTRRSRRAPPRCAVAATVVAPSPPRAQMTGRSRTEHFDHVVGVRQMLERLVVEPDAHQRRRALRSSPGPRPRRAPTSSISRATRRLSGRGSPWAMIVLSSATTGPRAASASATSPATRIYSACTSASTAPNALSASFVALAPRP